MAATPPSLRQIAPNIEPVVSGKGVGRPATTLPARCSQSKPLGFFQPLQFATDIDERGKLRATASSARMTRSLAAMTSSRKDAASSGAPRHARPEGAGADQFAVTLGLRLANQ